MPSLQPELGPTKAISAGTPRLVSNVAKGLQEELTKALSMALSQLELLSRPGSRRGRTAQRKKAQAFVESALETSQMLLADLQTVPPAKRQETGGPHSQELPHELLLHLRRQLAQSPRPDIQALPLLLLGSLPELPRIVSRTLTEVTLRLLEGSADALSGLRICPQAHGLSLQLLCKPMAEREVATLRSHLECELAGGSATRLALVGACIAPRAAQHTDVLISIVWPALEDGQA